VDLEIATDTALPARDIGPRASGAVGLAGILLLGCGWSVTALGATSLLVDCQDIGRSLQRLEAPAIELSISLVDLPDNNTNLGLAEPIDAAGAAPNATVPYLYLTSRVESMLREVFADDAPDQDETRWQEIDQQDSGTKHDTAVPPVAEGHAEHPSLPALRETELSDTINMMPRFQRPMYRTDI